MEWQVLRDGRTVLLPVDPGASAPFESRDLSCAHILSHHPFQTGSKRGGKILAGRRLVSAPGRIGIGTSRTYLLVSCTALSLWSLVVGPYWVREGSRELASAKETLRRHSELNPPQQGGCPNESTVIGWILAASAVGPSVRCTEGRAAFLAGIAGIVVALTGVLGATLRQRWTAWLGIAHAVSAGLPAVFFFVFAWHRDAKAISVLWFVYALVALWILIRHLRNPRLKSRRRLVSAPRGG